MAFIQCQLVGLKAGRSEITEALINVDTRLDLGFLYSAHNKNCIGSCGPSGSQMADPIALAIGTLMGSSAQKPYDSLRANG